MKVTIRLDEASKAAVAEAETRADKAEADRDALLVLLVDIRRLAEVCEENDPRRGWTVGAPYRRLLDAVLVPEDAIDTVGRSLLTAATRRGVAAGLEAAGRLPSELRQAAARIRALDIDTIVRDLEEGK